MKALIAAFALVVLSSHVALAKTEIPCGRMDSEILNHLCRTSLDSTERVIEDEWDSFIGGIRLHSSWPTERAIRSEILRIFDYVKAEEVHVHEIKASYDPAWSGLTLKNEEKAELLSLIRSGRIRFFNLSGFIYMYDNAFMAFDPETNEGWMIGAGVD